MIFYFPHYFSFYYLEFLYKKYLSVSCIYLFMEAFVDISVASWTFILFGGVKNQLYHYVFGCTSWPSYGLGKSVRLASASFDLLPSFF